MRKQIIIIWLTSIMVTLSIASCKKETTAAVSKEVAVSYPEITLKGDEIVILPVGGTFTEAGAILKDDITGAESDLQPVSNNVNTAVPGLYVVLYTAANANGFETTVGRKVAVTSVTGTSNIAGEFIRPATGVAMTIDQLSEGVYKITNPGGAGVGAATIVYMVETEKDVYSCPEQPNDAGFMALEDIEFSENGAVWRVLNAGYGSQLRSFVRQ
ncbi:immunoglobulin-like domain-containing protein [Flavihumibacter fluvii]|uniref:immunoglobulin-like domain-containing protein n=1 Tax=Flavihumibacter fluvii TaxID=2838157 RepID=UPI001BDF0A92|nr:immunoglobulin-like domain-containing protein [Flavihumibacter fluvii]ULQ53043.1 DUF5011 domain-containing protein [Flavihumibacter fluvii]